jgi:hypothetical protein
MRASCNNGCLFVVYDSDRARGTKDGMAQLIGDLDSLQVGATLFKNSPNNWW